MAKTGLSKLYYAKYTNNNGVISYTGGRLGAKAVSIEIDPGDEGGENFYADNGVAETASSFGSGTVTLGTDRLEPQTRADFFGCTLDSETQELHYNADDIAPYLGIGTIVRLQRSNTIVYQPVILPKVQFHRPTEEAETQGETIEFSGEEVTGDILRSDDTGDWKITSEHSTEAAADSWIKSKLGIND